MGLNRNQIRILGVSGFNLSCVQTQPGYVGLRFWQFIRVFKGRRVQGPAEKRLKVFYNKYR